MDLESKVAVCSRSFSQHPLLREMLLSEFKHVTFNDSGTSLQNSELIQFLKGHDKAIIALETIDEATLNNLPDLKVIGKYGVGLDKLDFKAMDRHGVKLGWTPGVNALAVAELTLALALITVRNVHVSNQVIRDGGWKQVKGRQLSSLTYGVLGCGHVGKSLVKLLSGFGCKILSHDIVDMPDFYKDHSVKQVTFDELLKYSDILSIHIPKNSQTYRLLDRKRLLEMKRGSLLINTARGGLVDEEALFELLENDHIAGAGLDVFEEEPPISKNLLLHPRVFSTTHIGGSSEEAILAMGMAAIDGLKNYKEASSYEK